MLTLNHVFKNEKIDEQKFMKLVKDIQIPCLLNLSACHLKLESNYEDVISHCNNVLKIDAENVKAYYRRALAYSKLKNFDLAKQDLAIARQLDPDDPLLIQAQQSVKNSENTRNEISFSIRTLIGKLIFLNCNKRKRL